MQQTHACPSCRRDVHADDAFCSYCGMRLQARTSNAGLYRRTQARHPGNEIRHNTCGSCNTPLLAEDVFCSACGARFGKVSQDSQPGDSSRISNLRKLEEATRGKFEFVRELGRGGMGTVYLAREVELERPVAIKVLSSNWLTDESMVERFRREARIIAALRHPSIVHVHGVGQVGDINYFIMDFIDGVSLGTVLRYHGVLPITSVQAVFYQVGSALSFAHRPARGVIHRDIKPGNIMLDVEGNSFVTDFGISKVAESQSGLTKTGLIIGTAEYMSPEQCRGDTVTHASDQYALGAVIYAMLCGAPPFTGPDYRVLMGHTSEPPAPIQELRPDCPRELGDAVMRMLAKLPAERWPDIKDALKATGARPLLADDPVRDELIAIVAQTRSRFAQGKPGLPRAKQDTGSTRTPTSLRISLPSQALETGDSIELRATKIFANGEETDSQEVSWQSGDESVVRINPTTGEMVAVGVGSTVITAWTAGVAESVAVDVSAPRVTQLAISPDVVELDVGDTRQLAAEARGRRGQVLDRVVLWSSSDPQTATVSDQGLVRAHRVGKASLLAHCEGVGAAGIARVTPAKSAGVHLLGVLSSLEIGFAHPLRAEVRDIRGNRLDRPITWSSSNPAVARIAEDGMLYGLARGKVEVTASCEGQKASAEVSVISPRVAKITIVAPPESMVVGDRMKFQVSTYDARGQALASTVKWSSSDASVLALEDPAFFRAMRPGKARVTASCEDVATSVFIEVRPIPVAQVVLSEPPKGLVVGDTFHIEATPKDERDRVLTSDSVTWQVDNASVLESTGGGRFRALSAGSANISAKSGTATASIPISVEALRAESIRIALPRTQFHVDDQVQLSAEVRDQRGALLEQPIQWTSSNSWTARVSPSGFLTGAAPGTVTITAECAGVQDSVVVTVTPAEWVTVVQKSVTAQHDEAGATAAAARTEPAASIDSAALRAGRESGSTAGPARRARLWVLIGVVAASAGAWMVMNMRSAEPPSTVIDPLPPPRVTAVSIHTADGRSVADAGVQMMVGDTVRLIARAEDSTGNAVPDATIAWSTGDSLLAGVDPSGQIVARRSGNVRITASTAGISSVFPVTIAVTPRLAEDGLDSVPGPRRGGSGRPNLNTTDSLPRPGRDSGPRGVQPPTPDGVLRLNVVPWARVLINGAVRDNEGQGLELSLKQGRYTLRLENPNMIVVDTIFEIFAGQATELRFQLRPRAQ
jgi:serine/threonine protein kinase